METHVLIDFENVQPKSLPGTMSQSTRLHVFVGSAQNKLPFDLVSGIQRLGNAVEYVQASGTGRNALDFMIAFRFGQLAQGEPSASFYIVSKDSGFGPLVTYARSRGLKVSVAKDLASIPTLSVKRGERAVTLEMLLTRLRNRGSSRPRKVKTLGNTLKDWLGGQASEAEVSAWVDLLREGGHVTITGTNVSYNL